VFEFHGWITLRSTGEAVDDDPPLPLDEIRAVVKAVDSGHLYRVDVFNGQYFVHIAGSHNHRQSAVIDMFAEIGRLAPGSYGLLHIWDDEDPGHQNEFRVHRLVRGEVTVHEDTLLSPCIPTLEDEWSADGG
jgi:hypothetical protein